MKQLYLLFLFIYLLCLACSSPEDKKEEVPTPVPTPFQLQFSDRFQPPAIPEDNPLTVEGVNLGRRLFYEKKLSGNNTMSCGSCHQQKLAFTDGQAFSTGIDGQQTTRSAMSLVNLAWNKTFNWAGEANSLEAQARIPIENPLEMHQNLDEAGRELQNTATYPRLFQKAFGTSTITSDLMLKALGQFTRTLISTNSSYDKYRAGEASLSVEELEGMQLFFTHPDPSRKLRGGNCGDCHGSDFFTLQQFHNNGLDVDFTDKGRGAVTGKATDNGRFKAPSLRNIAVTAPYMHDGRLKTLEEVLDHYNEHIQSASPNLDPLIIEASNKVGGKALELTPDEKAKIIKFLHTLTDESFLKDERFSEITTP
ncbi:cytochrome-c peroxidase [Adhaeribacter arboris]|uniref:Cytochrome-c peroxidase n=1 Tax=Adhaeribacter arboris TaxID=2072846 RepID=A0A2T2YAM2_9BACT|nr:cytochrome c peroxidase [Adhaeribacter arboris]PSR52559.1 cytochrome-c peroxidase [Adhaeribacter arboris]